MKIYLISNLLFFGNFIFAAPQNFIVIQKESISGMEQISLADERKNWTYISNTDGFTDRLPYFLGHYEVKLSSTDQTKVKIIIDAAAGAATHKKKPSFKHAMRYFVNGKEIQNPEIETDIHNIFTSIVDQKKLIPLNAVIIKKIDNEIEYEKWVKSLMAENTKKTPLKFCDQLVNEICSIDKGIFRVSKAAK